MGGALVACKSVHWLKKAKKEVVIVKLGFRKAYDSIRWSFVDQVLEKMGFGIWFLVDFRKEASNSAASFSALFESIQCAIEELHYKESDLEVRTSSKEMVSWIKDDYAQNWENRFTINKLRNCRSWLKNISISCYKKSDFLFFKSWMTRCNQAHERILLQEGST